MKSNKKNNNGQCDKNKNNVINNKWMYSIWLLISCLIGFILSLYTFYVEHAIELDENYTALCDISEKISCTKVFSSSYGKGFGFFGENSIFNLPNGLLGVFFYGDMMIMSLVRHPKIIKIQLILAITSMLLSIYLGYLLMFVLNDFCFICVSTYGVNIANLILTWKRFKLSKLTEEKIKTK